MTSMSKDHNNPAWPIMKPIRRNRTTENILKQHGTITPKNVSNVRPREANSMSSSEGAERHSTLFIGLKTFS